MKMIYLIDDNRDNKRDEYGAGYIDQGEFDDCLIHYEKLNIKSDFSFLDNAACVMIHDTFVDYIDNQYKEDSKKAREKILDVVQTKKIPYVCFTDGYSLSANWQEEHPGIVFGIKKSEFYYNLREFLETYRKTDVVDVRIIAFGSDFMKLFMFKWYQNIIGSIQNDDENAIITFEDIDKHSLQKFIKNSEPKVGISFNQLMNDIDDGKVTIRNFKDNVNRIIDGVQKYGKNISVWK